MRTAVLLALVLGLAAGCGQAVPPAARSAASDPSAPAAPSYPPIGAAEACPPGEAVHLPDDVGPVTEAYVCVQEVRTVDGDGEWSFSVVKGVTSGLDDLLRAYRTPDEAVPSPICDASLPVPLVVHLRGARPLAVRAPWDGCHEPTAAAVGAFAALGTTEVTAVKDRQVRSQLSLSTGCPDRYKDMLAVEEESAGPTQVSAVPRPVGPGGALCSYTVAPDDHGDRIGHLTSARVMTAEELDRINAELAEVSADPSCSRHGHARFALLGQSDTLVAVDGCAVQQDGGWWRATDGLRALVAE